MSDVSQTGFFLDAFAQTLYVSWRVKSDSTPGREYKVEMWEDAAGRSDWLCECPQGKIKHRDCKHIKKVKEARAIAATETRA